MSKVTLKKRMVFDIIYKEILYDEDIIIGGNKVTKKCIKVNYKPLWKLLIDREMSKSELRKRTGIAGSTFFKMSNNENVSLDVLVRICIDLECGLDDIVEIER